MRRPASLLLLVLVLGACDADAPVDPMDAPALADAGSPGDPRAYHPVVLSAHEGFDLGPLLNAPVRDLVAFAFDAARSAFVQIPVQVDERYVYDAAQLYEGITTCQGGWCEDLPGHVVTLDYADSDHAAGPDPNNRFDADDEAVLLLSDFGNPTQGHPPGVYTQTRVEVKATFGDGDSYAYLYRRSDGSLDSSAGRNYVTYHFETVNPVYDRVGVRPGDFTGQLTSTYHGVSNPEESWVETASYRMQFADRWVLDHLAVGPPESRSPDLLTYDAFRGTDNPNNPGFTGCVRWTFTGSASEGGFLVNRDGPIRGIRRMLGFNSGPITEVRWTFYPHGAAMRMAYRLHHVGHGLALFLHLSDAATGYVHGYGTHRGGLVATDPVDGSDPGFGRVRLPEWQPFTELSRSDDGAWQTLSDPTGGYGWALLYGVESTIPFHRPDEQPSLFYRDDGALFENCNIDDVTGSNFDETFTTYRGAHGIEVPQQSPWGPGTHLEDGGLPNTDPRHEDKDTPRYDLTLHRLFAFGPDPAAALEAVRQSPTVTTRPR